MAQFPYSTTTIFRLPKVKSETGQSRSWLYQSAKDGLFTPPMKTGRSSGWPAREVAALNAARIAGKSDAEIRELVADLVAERVAGPE